MKEWLLRRLASLVQLGLRILVPVLVQLGKTKSGRERMAQVSRLLRQAEHQDTADAIRARYAIDPSVHWGIDSEIRGTGKIEIGAGTYLGSHCFVVSEPKDAYIHIGKDCAISHNVHIRTAGYDTGGNFAQSRNGLPKWGTIIIGDDVWIGANVFIVGGVTIGSNSVIGANSVVTHDVEPDSVYGGVPARLIRKKTVVDSVTA